MRLLKKGDKIALINIANMPPKRFHNQISLIERYLSELGFCVANYLDYENTTQISIRFNNFHNCFKEDSIKAIFPISNGSFDYRLLESIDYDLIEKHPKIICGYSGLSALIFMIAYKTGVPTFYGPHINSISGYSSKRENMYTVYSFWNLLEKQRLGKCHMNLLEKRNFFQYPSGYMDLVFRNIYYSKELKHKYINEFCKSEIIYGTIYALTLEVLYELISYINIDIKEDFILMLDIFEQSFEEIERSLRKIIQNMNLVYCKCIFISTITYRDMKDVDKTTYWNIVFQFLQYIKISVLPRDIELLYGFPLGHSRYKLTLPVGVKVALNTSTGEIQIKDFCEADE